MDTLRPDLTAAADFLAALAGGDRDATHTFQTFDDSQAKRPELARVLHGTLAELGDRLQRLNQAGAGVFVTINQTDGSGQRRNASVTELRAVFVDCDNGWPAIPLDPPPSVIVSSVGGPHIYWLLIPGEPLDAFRDAQRGLARHYSTDPAVNDLARVMRLPGYWHRKTAEPRLVTLERADVARCYTLGEVVPQLEQAAPEAAAVAPSSSTASSSSRGSTGAPRFSGDVRSLDVEGLFSSLGQYRRPLGGGKHAVVCPWADSHTTPDHSPTSNDTSTVIWESDGENWPGFRCLHGHCDGRSIVDVIATVGGDTIDAWCAAGWQPAEHAALVEASRAWRAKGRQVREAELELEEAIEERVTIVTEADVQTLRDQALDALSKHPGVYVSGGMLARIGDGSAIQHMARGAVESALCDVARFRKSHRGTLKPAGIPDQVPRILLAMSLTEARRFRALDVITKTPFWTASGRPVTTPGYDQEARSVLLAPPPIADKLFPDGAAALRWLCNDLLGDFPWESPAERANFLGALLVPMVRPLIVGPVPLHNIEASKRGTGKSLLAQALMVIFGLDPEMSTLPRDEAEVEKKILGVLRAGQPVHVFDNVKHAVTSAALDIVMTSTYYTGRLLGQNLDLRLPVKQLWIMTSNNAKLSEDASRRTVRIRLVSKVEYPEDRDDFQHRDLLTYCRKNRPLILSALWQCVAEWIDADRPTPPEPFRRTLGSYHSWAQVIGGILFHAGETEHLANARKAREEQNMDADEWPEFLDAWHDEHGPLPCSAKQLWTICNANDLLIGTRGGGSELSQIKRLSNELRGVRDSIRFGYRISIVRDNNRKGLKFACTPAGEVE